MKICVPSKGRAGLTTTNKLLKDNCIFYIPSSEEHQYKNIIKNYRVVPAKIKGITATRNFILNDNKGEYVVMLDDDVKKTAYIKRFSSNVTNIALNDPSFWLDEFERYFDICGQMGYKIWGAATDCSTKTHYSYKPFMFKTYALGSVMGIINDGEYLFNEKYAVKEDYEICLRHIRDKGGLLGVRYLYWTNHHIETDGV